MLIKEMFRGKMIKHVPLILFSSCITAIYEGNAARALYRITYKEVFDPFMLICFVLSSYNFANFVLSIFRCKLCYDYGDYGERRVRICGAFGMVIFSIVAIALFCIIFRGVFSDIDI